MPERRSTDVAPHVVRSNARRGGRRGARRWARCYTGDMITAAVTAAIGAILAYFGVPPGPYLAGVAIAVKLTIVGVALLLGARAVLQKKQEAAPDPAPASAPQDERAAP